MGASDKTLQKNDADAGKYFLYRNTEVGVVNFEINKVKFVTLYNTM